MRTPLVVGLCLALTSCDDKPASRPTVAVDAMWKMAPEGTRGALVIAPYALGMLDGGVAALKTFFQKGNAELSPISAQLDDLLGALGPLKDFSLATLHLTPTKPGALFFVKDGMVAVLPIKDRDAFVAKAKGTKATTPDGTDKLGDNFCKMVGKHYTCASNEALLGAIGKSAIGERIKKLKARGDIELVATELPLQGLDQPRSSVAAAITIERGSWVIRGMLGNPPDTVTAKLAAPTRPRTKIGKSAGFGVFDIRQVLDPKSEDKIVEGVTEAELVKSISGAMTIDVPAGSTLLDMRMPLSDPKPFEKVLAKCTEVRSLAALGAEIVDGVCRVKALQANLLLDLWVEDNTLRIGKKGATVEGKSVVMPAVARELATGKWSLAFWGRGTMFAKQAKSEPNDISTLDPRMAAPIRALSMLNEIGFGVRRDGDDLRFVGTMRTSFGNAQPIVDKLVDITGLDVVGNTASNKGEAIAKAHVASDFAHDFNAGQHGLLIPTQMLEGGINILIPALVMYVRGGGKPPTPEAPPAPGVQTAALVKAFATQGYEIWKAKNPDKPCPPSMTHFAAAIGPNVPSKDEWGNDLVLKCGKDLPKEAKDVAILSHGPDGKPGTEDDIKSY